MFELYLYSMAPLTSSQSFTPLPWQLHIILWWQAEDAAEADAGLLEEKKLST